MVGPSKSRPPMSHRKTDLGIPCRSKSAKVVLELKINELVCRLQENKYDEPADRN
jgi:hypothetical protein